VGSVLIGVCSGITSGICFMFRWSVLVDDGGTKILGLQVLPQWLMVTGCSNPAGAQVRESVTCDV
jgi:hypothetical protein